MVCAFPYLNKPVMAPGAWVAQAVADDTAMQVEDSILTRARQMRIASLNKI